MPEDFANFTVAKESALFTEGAPVSDKLSTSLPVFHV